MSFRLLAVVLLFSALSLRASEEDVIRESLAVEQILNDIYASVKDMDSARAAVPKLKEWARLRSEQDQKEGATKISNESLDAYGKRREAQILARKAEGQRILKTVPEAVPFLNEALATATREVREKRIGPALPILEALQAYASGQDRYRRNDWNKDGILEYAPSLAQLCHDPAGTDVVTISEDIAQADAELPLPKAYKGYLFKVLRGKMRDGAVVSYVKPGTKAQAFGYAIIAFPAVYGDLKKSYQISDAGTVYTRDFGPETVTTVKAIETYDMQGWKVFD